MAYSHAVRLPSDVFQTAIFDDSQPPESAYTEPQDTVGMMMHQVRRLPDVSSMTRSTRRLPDMSSAMRPVERWHPDMSSAMQPTARAQPMPLSTHQDNVVPAPAPQARGVVMRATSGLGGGGHHGGRHGGGHHGGGRGWGGSFGPWGGYSYPYDYYPIYEPIYQSDLPIAVDEVSRMVARDPELVAVTEAALPERVIVTVRSSTAAARVRSMVPASVRGFPVVVIVGPGIAGEDALAGVFSENLFSGLDTGIEGFGATLQINMGQGDPAVRALQTQLVRIGALAGGAAAVDGKWGTHTADAVRTAATMVGFTGGAYTTAGSSAVAVPDELLTAINAYTPPGRTVEPQPEPQTPPSPGQMLPSSTAANAPGWFKRNTPVLLVGGGLAVATAAVLLLTRKPKSAVTANRHRARKRSGR